MTEAAAMMNSVWSVALLRIVLAVLCGGIIGMEWAYKGGSAGLKTFSLVCMGAALVMTTNQFVVLFVTDGAGDVTRLAAQVVSGIGFLGAGTIIVTGGTRIHGLTTAAALWVTAAIGIALGSGYYAGGVLATAAVCLLNIVFSMVDTHIRVRSRYMEVSVDVVDEEALLRVEEFLVAKNLSIRTIQRRPEYRWYDTDTCVVINVDFRQRVQHKPFLEELRALPGVRFVKDLTK